MKNAIRDRNKIHTIVLRIINVILVFKVIFFVKNVKSAIKILKINIFIVRDAFNAIRVKKKIGFIATNANNASK